VPESESRSNNRGSESRSVGKNDKTYAEPVETEIKQDLRSYCDHCHKFIVIASAAKQSRSTQNTDCNGLLRRLRRLAMTTCLAHFVMEIT
jgi:hypothetical protein